MAALVSIGFATLVAGVWHAFVDSIHADRGAVAKRRCVRAQGSALASGSLLATPDVPDCDPVVFAVAIVLFVRHGMARGFRCLTLHVFTLLCAMLDRA